MILYQQQPTPEQGEQLRQFLLALVRSPEGARLHLGDALAMAMAASGWPFKVVRR